MTEEQEIELAHHVMRVHWALGEGQDPQDIEWAHDGDTFYVLQARPVTEFPFHTFDGAKKFPIYWSNANIKDAVPGVASFFTWSLIRQVIDDVLYATHAAADYPIPPGIQTVRRFDGHAYFDFSAMQWCVYDAFGVLPSETAKSIGGHQPEIPLGDENPLRGPEGKRRNKARSGRPGSLLTLAPGRRRRSPASGSHRTERADFPHSALRKLIHSTASACSSRCGRRKRGRCNGCLAFIW